MIEIRPARHGTTGKGIAEILKDGRVVGVVYPTEGGIGVVSAHISSMDAEEGFAGRVVEDNGQSPWSPIPAVLINFDPSPYHIVDGEIVRSSDDPESEGED